MTLEDRFIGCMMGLLVGDALGSHFEGQTANWISRRYPSMESLVKDPPAAPWHYTDDTQMAVGVAESLIADGEIVEDQLCRVFAENYTPHRGYGRGTRVVLDAVRDGQDHRHWAREIFDGGSFGNGAAMRVAAVGLFFHDDLDRVWEQARLSAIPTHVHALGIEGAQLLAAAVALTVRDEARDRARLFQVLQEQCVTDEFRQRLEQARRTKSHQDMLRLGNGIAALDSVVTAITCSVMSPTSFEESVASAILLGGDTDTIAAMSGAVAGARLGGESIPRHWLESVEDDHKGSTYVRNLAQNLCDRWQRRKSDGA